MDVVGLEGDHARSQGRVQGGPAARAQQDPFALEAEGDRQHDGQGADADPDPPQRGVLQQGEALRSIEHLQTTPILHHGEQHWSDGSPPGGPKVPTGRTARP